METIEVSPSMFNHIDGLDDIELVDNISKRRAARKAKRSAKKAARKAKRAARKASKRGGGDEQATEPAIVPVLETPIVGEPYVRPEVVRRPVRRAPIEQQEDTGGLSAPEGEMEQGSAPPYVAEPYVEEDGGSPQEQASENLPDDPALDEDGNFNYESSYGTDNVTRVGKFLRKAAKSKVLAVATGGMSKLGSKEGRKQLGTIAKNVALMPLLAPLLPFAPAMKKQLKKQGLSVPKNPLDLYKLFYKEVVQKHKKNSFGDDYEDFDFNLEDDNIIDDIISGLIKGIVSFFKKSKEKKDGG